MTRINLVDPAILADQHLFSEYLEIRHVVPSLRRSLKGANWPRALPKTYTLGAGHVGFFYYRIKFLSERYILITAELLKRGYKFTPAFFDLDVPEQFLGSYSPTPEAIKINIDRIIDRIKLKPKWYKLRGDPLPPRVY